MNAQDDDEFERFLREKAAEAKRDLKFPATLFLRMLGADGGYKTAVKLLSARHPSDGFTDLLALGRPDLTVEALVVESKWRDFFDPALIKKAEDLLRKIAYPFKPYIAPPASPTNMDGQREHSSTNNQSQAGVFDDRLNRNAIDDLDVPQYLPIPDRVVRMVSDFRRDAKVRQAVLRRANGKCEYCNAPGFEMLDGSHYLEAHHVINLAQDGPDTMSNVIGLCPHHHKEAHYGRHADALEREFLAILLRQNLKIVTNGCEASTKGQ